MSGIPGPVGFSAFVAVKFCGYALAGAALKKMIPAVQMSAAKIAVTRIGLGIPAGLLFYVGYVYILGWLFGDPFYGPPRSAQYLSYFALGILRVFVWLLAIYIAARSTGLAKSRLWMLAAGGAVWSCVLDVPAAGLAWITPWRIYLC